jgi:putative transposase
MSNYRRARVAGATYFFTVNLRDRSDDLLVREIDLLRWAVRVTRERHPFYIDAWVVLPEHMHCMWTLPPGDADFAVRWKSIKFAFAKHLPAVERRTINQYRRNERGIWQRRYWEHLIRDNLDYQRHFDYIHYNPLKHGHVQHLADWPYSTFHRAVKMNIYPANWHTEPSSPVENYGESPARTTQFHRCPYNRWWMNKASSTLPSNAVIPIQYSANVGWIRPKAYPPWTSAFHSKTACVCGSVISHSPLFWLRVRTLQV